MSAVERVMGARFEGVGVVGIWMWRVFAGVWCGWDVDVQRV